MATLPHEPPPFFKRGPSPLARLTFFGLLSLALLFADGRYRYLEGVRQVVARVLYPLQRAALLPVDAAARIGEYFANQGRLTEENRLLRQRLLEAEALSDRIAAVERDGAALRALSASRGKLGGGVVAQVLFSARDPFAQRLFVGSGSSQGVAPGQAVVDEDGVIGQVTRVYPGLSEVTLLTDKDHAVPVRLRRTGARSVLFGSGAGRLPELRFVANSADLQPGDVLVTSGIDGVYPPGLSVAVVASVERDAGAMFARVTCRPLGGVDRADHVLILPSVPSPGVSRPEEAEKAPETARKGGRGPRRAAR